MVCCHGRVARVILTAWRMGLAGKAALRQSCQLKARGGLEFHSEKEKEVLSGLGFHSMLLTSDKASMLLNHVADAGRRPESPGSEGQDFIARCTTSSVSLSVCATCPQVPWG